VAIIASIGALAWGGLFIRDIGTETATLHSRINTKQAETNILLAQIASANSNIDQQNEAIAIQQEQITQIEAQIQPIEATESILNDTLAGLEQGLDKVNYDLREIVNLWLPTNINLHSINYVGDSVTINGLAPDEAAIFSYARALRSSGRFPTVVILSITETFKGEEIRLFDFQFLLR
jgi:Tfp pilus assembly protein PilN